MPNLGVIDQNYLVLDRETLIPPYVPTVKKMFVTHRFGRVFLVLDGVPVEFSTVAAHKAGMTMVKMASTSCQNELVVLTLNGVKIRLLPDIAHRVAAGLLWKADKADDWQLGLQERNNGNR